VIENALVLWGIGLLGAAVLLGVLELFVPSGGIIGIVAMLCAVAGVVAFWRHSALLGVSSLLVVLILTPVMINFGLRVMPHTPFGKQLFLSDSSDSEADVESQAERRAEEQALVGAEGVALTDLRPIGTVNIDGTRIEVLAAGPAIDRGTKVRVVEVQGRQVKVRPV